MAAKKNVVRPKKCRRCGMLPTAKEPMILHYGWQMQCTNCGRSGCIAPTFEEAATEWNKDNGGN